MTRSKLMEILKGFVGAVAFAGLSGCVMRAGPDGFRLSLLQSDYGMEFIDADGTNFSSKLDLAAFSKLEGDVAEMGYRWDPESGTISVGRAVQGLDQTPQVAAVTGIVQAAVKGAVEAFIGQLNINRAAEVELERIRATVPTPTPGAEELPEVPDEVPAPAH